MMLYQRFEYGNNFICFISLFVFSAGMQAIFEIKKCFPYVHKPRPHGELRNFFIAAEEEVWDYAPTPPNDGFVTVNYISTFTVY